MILHPLLRRAFDHFYDATTSSQKNAPSSALGDGTSFAKQDQPAGQARLEKRMNFDLAFNLVFLLALHGSSLPKILTILSINYYIATKLEGAYVPTATWVFNIAILFANELAHGYSYAKIIEMILPSTGDGQNTSLTWGVLLDSYGGLLSRWDIHFNITVLRLISYNLDLHWARQRSGSASPLEVSPEAQLFPHMVLTKSRRSNWTSRTFRSANVSHCQSKCRTSRSGTILHTHCMRHYI